MIELLGAGNSRTTCRIRQLYAAHEIITCSKGKQKHESSNARCDTLRSAQRLSLHLIPRFGAQDLGQTPGPKSARANIPHRMKVDSPMPSLEGATEWLNQAMPNALETKGRPTLVHFWSLSSEISEANLPQVAELRDRRKREGLRVIAVHLPRSEG